jgi:DNA-binding NarL/FixJ family response regulator
MKRRQLVVQYMLEGLRNREIAERMGIAEKTVKDHLWREFKLRGVRSRVEYVLKVHNEMRSQQLGKKVAEIITGGFSG